MTAKPSQRAIHAPLDVTEWWTRRLHASVLRIHKLAAWGPVRAQRAIIELQQHLVKARVTQITSRIA